MEYNDLVRDFAYRTYKNLEFVKKAARLEGKTPEVYEVTQLVNSLLGLIVFPQQAFYENIPSTSLEDLIEIGWPSIKIKRVSGETECRTLKDLARYLRNGVAHFNLKVKSDECGQIAGFELSNKRGNRITHIIELTVQELEVIAKKFFELLLSHDFENRLPPLVKDTVNNDRSLYHSEWGRLLFRYGFRFVETPDGTFDLTREKNENIDFLRKILKSLNPDGLREFGHKLFGLVGPVCKETEFVRAYYENHCNVEGCDPEELKFLEPHVAALVRHFNELGLRTHYSCEGHRDRERRETGPIIGFHRNKDTKVALAIIDIADTALEKKLSCLVYRENYLKIRLCRPQDECLHYVVNVAEFIGENRIQFKNIKLQLDALLGE